MTVQNRGYIVLGFHFPGFMLFLQVTNTTTSKTEATSTDASQAVTHSSSTTRPLTPVSGQSLGKTIVTVR